jgi:hypothetical protein
MLKWIFLSLLTSHAVIGNTVAELLVDDYNPVYHQLSVAASVVEGECVHSMCNGHTFRSMRRMIKQFTANW